MRKYLYTTLCILVCAFALLYTGPEAAQGQETVPGVPSYLPLIFGIYQIPQVEYQALIGLYNSTDGDNWYKKDGWLVYETPCYWYGVSCRGGHVISLELPGNYLRGKLPPEIGDLTYLELISLDYIAGNKWNPERHNYITGLPPEIGQLAALQTLNLEGTQLRGLPAEFGNLANLQSLKLSRNQLTEVPAEFGNLTNLQTLLLGANQLTEVPAEFGNLTNLQTLSLSQNWLTGLPVEFGNLTSLQTLYLSENYLTDLPVGFGNLTNLRKLWLANKYLSKSFSVKGRRDRMESKAQE